MEGVSHLYSEINKYHLYFLTPNKSPSCRQRGTRTKIMLLSPFIKRIYIAKIKQCLTVNIQSCGFALSSTRADLPKVFSFLITIHEQAHKILTKKCALV